MNVPFMFVIDIQFPLRLIHNTCTKQLTNNNFAAVAFSRHEACVDERNQHSPTPAAVELEGTYSRQKTAAEVISKSHCLASSVLPTFASRPVDANSSSVGAGGAGEGI